MFIFKLLNFLAGYKNISCTSQYANETVNIIVKNELDYWGMKREPDGELRFSMLTSEYKKLTEITKNGLSVERTKGLPQLVHRYRKRVGIPIGLVILIVILKLSTMFVWDVTVSGNESVSDAEIIECLESLGCSVGTYIPSVDFYNICHEFILENESISWISVNMIGTTASVKVIERDAKESLDDDGNGTPTNLVAARDGIIYRLETSSGKSSVKVGDPVTKGQLLVSGVLEIGNPEEGKFTLVRSRGRVFAETERVFTVTVPLKNIKKTYSERKNVYKYIKFFGKTIKVKENSSILDDECVIIEERERLILFEGGKLTGGVPLPITVIKGYAEEFSEKEVTLSEDEALAMAKLEMAELFASELDSADIISRTEEFEVVQNDDGKALVLVWSVTCIENIAEEVPIGIS